MALAPPRVDKRRIEPRGEGANKVVFSAPCSALFLLHIVFVLLDPRFHLDILVLRREAILIALSLQIVAQLKPVIARVRPSSISKSMSNLFCLLLLLSIRRIVDRDDLVILLVAAPSLILVVLELVLLVIERVGLWAAANAGLSLLSRSLERRARVAAKPAHAVV